MRRQNWKGQFGGICTILLREQKNPKILNLVKPFNKKKKIESGMPANLRKYMCILVSPFLRSRGKGQYQTPTAYRERRADCRVWGCGKIRLSSHLQRE